MLITNLNDKVLITIESYRFCLTYQYTRGGHWESVLLVISPFFFFTSSIHNIIPIPRYILYDYIPIWERRENFHLYNIHMCACIRIQTNAVFNNRIIRSGEQCLTGIRNNIRKDGMKTSR